MQVSKLVILRAAMKNNLLIPIVRDGTGAPVFFVPSAGTTIISLVKLARSLTSQRPVHAFEHTGLEDRQLPPTSLEEVAAAYLAEIRAVQESGPYTLGGHCWGGLVAFDIAAKLEAEGDEVALLLLLESIPPRSDAVVETGDVTNPPDPKSVAAETEKALNVMYEQIRGNLLRLPPQTAERFGRLCREQIDMGIRYRASPIAAPMVLLRTPTHPGLVFQGWTYLGTGGFEERVVPGDAFSMLSPPHVGVLAAQLDKVLCGPDATGAEAKD